MKVQSYLIADEVGLGKTKIAAGIADGIYNGEGRARILYMASNSRISAKNIEEFELDNFKIEELKAFQKASVNRVLASFGDVNRINDNGEWKCPNNTLKWKTLGKQQPDRLSMMYSGKGMLDILQGSVSFALSLSPRTSFLQSAKNSDLKCGSYIGEDKERNEMKEKLEKVKKMIENVIEKVEGEEKKKYWDILLSVAKEILSKKSQKMLILAALIYAIDYEITPQKNDARKIVKYCIDCLKSLSKGHSQIETRFPLVRRIFCNANALLINPNIIILDEIQRFRANLEKCDEGYSVIQMLEFLKSCAEKGCKLREKLNEQDKQEEQDNIYVIMLSATPYQYNHMALESIWTPDENKSQQEDAYEDFDSLKGMMETYGANIKEKTFGYICRTERKDFFTKEERDIVNKGKEIPVIPATQYKKHLGYIADLYGREECNELRKYISSHIEYAPEFWRFRNGYKDDKDKKEAIKKMTSSAKMKGIDSSQHMLLSTLLDKAFPKKTECLLWVTPTIFSESSEDNPFVMNSGLGKTLVFSHYKCAARSVATLCSEYIQKRLDKSLENVNNKCNLNDVILSKQSVAFCSIMSVCPSVNKEEKKEEALESLNLFFNQPYAKKAVYTTYGCFSENAVGEYCRMGCFQSMIEEYRAVLKRKSDEEFIEHLCRILRGAVNRKDKKTRDITMADYYTDDPGENNGHDKSYERLVGDRFNSPFYPFVLSVTATAQEGLDFHYYADKIMHWQPAQNVSAFMQREGRIDRPMSLTIRRRYYEIFREDTSGEDAPRTWNSGDIKEFFLGIFGETEEAFKVAKRKLVSNKNSIESIKHLIKAYDAGFFPMWYIPKFSEKSAQINRIVAASQFSKEYDVFSRLIRGCEEYYSFSEEQLCAFLENYKLKRK